MSKYLLTIFCDGKFRIKIELFVNASNLLEVIQPWVASGIISKVNYASEINYV